MKSDIYLGMRPGDLDGKSYAKYWNPEMGPLPEHVQRALMHGVEAAELGFPVSEAGRLLEPGYLPLENGFTRLDDGQVFVSVLTRMPGVTSRMIDWWFGWHFMESQRYKLWHPRAHLSNRAERMVGDDPGLSDREKYLGNPNYVSEYVGGDRLDIVITFSEASDFFDVSRFRAAGVGTAICGVVGFQSSPLAFALLIHLIRETDDGCEMRSRFWLGRIAVRGLPAAGALGRIAGSRFVARRAVPIGLGRDMVVHCAAEMNHLAGFLPELYADHHAGG
ncbi:MAG: DAPG hydrolase family protein [Myxococcota bacterium]